MRSKIFTLAESLFGISRFDYEIETYLIMGESTDLTFILLSIEGKRGVGGEQATIDRYDSKQLVRVVQW